MDMSDEDNAEAIQQLVGVQVSLEKYTDALTNADNLLEQDPANIPVRRLRVEALTAIGDETEAAAELDRIQRLKPATETDETAGTDFAAAP